MTKKDERCLCGHSYGEHLFGRRKGFCKHIGEGLYKKYNIATCYCLEFQGTKK